MAPTVHTLEGAKIIIQSPPEHNPPHVHVTEAALDYMVDIQTGQVMAGRPGQK